MIAIDPPAVENEEEVEIVEDKGEKVVVIDAELKLEGAPIPVRSLFNLCANKIIFGPDKLDPQDVKPHVPKTVVRRLEYFYDDVVTFVRRRNFVTNKDYTELIHKHAVTYDEMKFVCINSDATVLQLKPYLPPEEYFSFCALNGMEDECKATWDRHFKDVFNEQNSPSRALMGIDIVDAFALHYSGATSDPIPYAQLAFDAAHHGLRLLMIRCLDRVPEDEIGNVLTRCIYAAAQADDDYWDLMDALWCHKHRQKVTLQGFFDMLEDMSTDDTVANHDDWCQEVICKFLEFSDDTPFAQVACRLFLTWMRPDDLEVLDAKVRRHLKNSRDERDRHDLKVYSFFRTLPPLTEESMAALLENSKFPFLHLPEESKDFRLPVRSAAGPLDDEIETESIDPEMPMAIINPWAEDYQCPHEPKCSLASPQVSSPSEGYCSVESRPASTSSLVEDFDEDMGPSTSRKRKIDEISNDDDAPLAGDDLFKFGESVKRFCCGLSDDTYRQFKKEVAALMAAFNEKKKPSMDSDLSNSDEP